MVMKEEVRRKKELSWVGRRASGWKEAKTGASTQPDRRISDTHSFPSLPLCTVIWDAPISGLKRFITLLFHRNLTFWISPTSMSTSMSRTCTASGLRDPLVTQTEISCQRTRDYRDDIHPLFLNEVGAGFQQTHGRSANIPRGFTSKCISGEHVFLKKSVFTCPLFLFVPNWSEVLGVAGNSKVCYRTN